MCICIMHRTDYSAGNGPARCLQQVSIVRHKQVGKLTRAYEALEKHQQQRLAEIKKTDLAIIQTVREKSELETVELRKRLVGTPGMHSSSSALLIGCERKYQLRNNLLYLFLCWHTHPRHKKRPMWRCFYNRWRSWLPQAWCCGAKRPSIKLSSRTDNDKSRLAKHKWPCSRISCLRHPPIWITGCELHSIEWCIETEC